MKDAKSEPYYLVIEEPVEIRKNVLSSAKEMLEILQGFEKLKKVRQEKEQTIEEMKAKLKDIFATISQLKTQIPKVKEHIPHELSEVIRPERKPRPLHKEQKKPSKPMTTMEKLEKELAEIEAQLSKLA